VSEGEGEPGVSKATRNERIKLRATLFNNLAVAFLLAALLQPALAILRIDAVLRALDALSSLAFGLVGYIFHAIGQHLLGGLSD